MNLMSKKAPDAWIDDLLENWLLMVRRNITKHFSGMLFPASRTSTPATRDAMFCFTAFGVLCPFGGDRSDALNITPTPHCWWWLLLPPSRRNIWFFFFVTCDVWFLFSCDDDVYRTVEENTTALFFWCAGVRGVLVLLPFSANTSLISLINLIWTRISAVLFFEENRWFVFCLQELPLTVSVVFASTPLMSFYNITLLLVL